MRHSEKKKSEKVHLSTKGRIRAEYFPVYLNDMIMKGLIQRPNYLVAMKQRSLTNSNRPYETIEPLSKSGKKHLKIHNDFTADEVDKLVESINDKSMEGKVVLVCWSHDNLPMIANKLGLSVNGWSSDGKSNDKKDFRTIWVLKNDHRYEKFESFKMFRISDKDNIVYDSDIFQPVVTQDLGKNKFIM